MAGRISALIPQAEPVLTRYVEVVNDARLWIDLKMQSFIANQSDPAAADPDAGATAAPAADTTPPVAPAPEPAAIDPPATVGTETPTPQVTPPAGPATEQTDG